MLARVIGLLSFFHSPSRMSILDLLSIGERDQRALSLNDLFSERGESDSAVSLTIAENGGQLRFSILYKTTLSCKRELKRDRIAIGKEALWS